MRSPDSFISLYSMVISLFAGCYEAPTKAFEHFGSDYPNEEVHTEWKNPIQRV